MCVKLPYGDLKSSPCLPHPTSTYTFKVIIAPKVCGGNGRHILELIRICYINNL